MFYNLTEEDIENFRQKTFPREIKRGEFLKRVVLNDSGTDNLLKITLSVQDGAKGVFKILDNPEALKYMKLKVFEIPSQKMYKTIADAKIKSIAELEQIINLNAALSQVLAPSTDYVRSTDDKTLKKKKNSKPKNLFYEINFLLPREIIQYFSLGLVFYFDKEDFLVDKNIEEKFINDEILFDNILLYKLIENEKNINPVIQDIRLIKSTFKDLRVFDNLLSLITSNKVLNFLNPANVSVPNNDSKTTISPTNNSNLNPPPPPNSPNAPINSTSQTNPIGQSVGTLNAGTEPQVVPQTRLQGLANRLEKEKIKNAAAALFNMEPSNTSKSELLQNIIVDAQRSQEKAKAKTFIGPFYSRNMNKTLGFVFVINYEKIIDENTTYKSLFKRTKIKQEFINKCKICSIKILREKINENIKNTNLPIPNSTEVLVVSSQRDGESIEEVQTKYGSITELPTPVDSKISITRAFSVTDKELFFSSARGRYRYGVEIQISEAITDFLSAHVDKLSANLTNLIEYYNETNKVVKIVTNNSGDIILSGVYDPLRNAFTQDFVQKFNSPRPNNLPSYQKSILEAATDFITTLNFIGLDIQNSSELIKTIASSLSPTTTSAESINYFIKIYEQLINRLNKTIKDNINNSFTVKKWFTNDYIDTTVSIDYGYNLLNVSDYKGLGTITSFNYLKQLEDDINRHFGNYYQQTEPNEFVETGETFNDRQAILNAIIPSTAAYLSINKIYLPNKQVDLTVLGQNSGSISNLEFSEIELQIKALIDGDGSITTKTDKILPSTANDNKIVRTVSLSSTSLESDLSISIKSTIDINLNDPFRTTFQDELVKIQNTTQVELFLSLLKQYESNNSETTKKVLEPTVIQRVGSLSIPTQVDILKTGLSRILKPQDEYLDNIDCLSKFNILFNTIHSIEVLEFTETLEEKWTLLTRQKARSLPVSLRGFHICRMKNYKNENESISGMENIKLPIFHEYFLLFSTTTSETTAGIIESLSERREQQVKYQEVKQGHNSAIERLLNQAANITNEKETSSSVVVTRGSTSESQNSYTPQKSNRASGERGRQPSDDVF